MSPENENNMNGETMKEFIAVGLDESGMKEAGRQWPANLVHQISMLGRNAAGLDSFYQLTHVDLKLKGVLQEE